MVNGETGGESQSKMCVANSKSCVGCKWLYSRGSGYSNYTWESTYVKCALDKNEALKEGNVEEPWDWKMDAPKDNWPMTNSQRCDSYEVGPMVALDVDGEDGPATYTQDPLVIVTICEREDREPHGYKWRAKQDERDLAYYKALLDATAEGKATQTDLGNENKPSPCEAEGEK